MWMSFWISHLLLFGPNTYAWIVLAFSDEWDDDSIEFYKTTLLDISVALGPPAWLLLTLGFIVVMWQNAGTDDIFYKFATPFITTIFLTLSALATTFVLYEYNYEARMYYDKDARAEYLAIEALDEEVAEGIISQEELEAQEAALKEKEA